MKSQLQSSYNSSPFGGEKKLWINFVPYAKRLFASHDDELWTNPSIYISMYSQAQSLLKSDILSVNIHDFYQSYLKQNLDLVDQWRGKKSRFVLKKIFALEEPRNIVLEVLTGIAGLYADQHPIVLVVPSPQSLLQRVTSIVYPDNESMLSSEAEIDAASMYMADFLRTFSNSKISGLLLEETSSKMNSLGKTIEFYQPISNLSKHYQWAFGLQLPDLYEDLNEMNDTVDFLLFEAGNGSSFNRLSETGIAIGGGLDKDFWIGNSSENLVKNVLAFGKIPEDAHPEQVLEKLSQIRMN